MRHWSDNMASPVLISLMICSRSASNQKDYPIQPVLFTRVRIDDAFWKPRLEVNGTVTVPHAFDQCERTGRLDNFAIAAVVKQGEQQGSNPFDETDVDKTIEGASYCLLQ